MTPLQQETAAKEDNMPQDPEKQDHVNGTAIIEVENILQTIPAL
jgi:hypothetical protein